MNLRQKKALEINSNKILETLNNVIPAFLTYLQEAKVINSEELPIVQAKETPKAKLMVLLKIIEEKDDGWRVTISYFRNNNYASLANELEKSAGEPVDSTLKASTPEDSESSRWLDTFRSAFASYYKSEYSSLPTMFGSDRSVNDVWVPLRIDEKTKSPKQKDSFDHLELLKRLADQKFKIALIKGDPGVGKTTLLKKIAYDWATNKIDHFSLVIALPLRYVGATEDFLHSAADYYANKIKLCAGNEAELFYCLNQLGGKLLICLDGLDEYGSLPQSPLKTLFASSFNSSTSTSSPSPPQLLPYKLVITSRPYACDVVNQDFYPLKFEMALLDEAHLAKFVQLYCETKDGAQKVTDYLKIHTKIVIKVPLILTFVCCLADLGETIPSNLTLLYEKLLTHMVKREISKNNLQEKISIKTWKNAEFVKFTTALAFDGCENNNFEFQNQNLSDAKDSFTCGFFLHKFNFKKEELYIEFPHRSIQEFFAALHCHHMILAGDKIERNSVMEIILTEDSQFGRFFFGLGLDEKMLEWLNPTLDDTQKIRNHGDELFSDPSHCLYLLSVCLSDCSKAEAKLLGVRLAASPSQLETKFKTNKSILAGMSNVSISPNFSWNESFLFGLNLSFLDEKKWNWSISHPDKPKQSRFTSFCDDLPVNLREKIETIQICFWNFYLTEQNYNKAGVIFSLDRLPPVSTLFIQISIKEFQVNFDVNYEMTTTTAPTRLRHFTFAFGKDDIPELKDLLSRQPDSDDLMIGETKKTGEKTIISWLTVTVRQNLDQSRLIKSLIRLAVKLSPPEAKLRKFAEKHCVTATEIEKVTNYFYANSNVAINFPLMLQFVCFLANKGEEIPTNLTLLYDGLLCHVMEREIQGDKLWEEIHINRWKESQVVKSLSEGAFINCRTMPYEFFQLTLDEYRDPNDSDEFYIFSCHKFVHGSILEFFAALHCYQLVLTPDKTERNSIMNQIVNRGNQFGRFFFGICSKEKRFEEMLEWLNPTYADVEMVGFAHNYFLLKLSFSLSDCSKAEAERLGQRLAVSLDQLKKKFEAQSRIRFKDWRNGQIRFYFSSLFYLNQSYQTGLNLSFLDDKRFSWSLSHVDKPKWSRITYVDGDLPANLRKQFDKIQVFMWKFNHQEPRKRMICSLDRLPPVSSLIIQCAESDFKMNFDLNYEITSATIQLQHFTFGFGEIDIPSLKDLLSDQPETDVSIIGETRKTRENQEIIWLTVRIRRSIKQMKMVKILIQLAVQVAVGLLETERKQKNCDLT